MTEDKKLTVFEEIDVSRHATMAHAIVIVSERNVTSEFEGEFLDQLILLHTFRYPTRRQDEQMTSNRLEDFDRQRTQEWLFFIAHNQMRRSIVDRR